MPGLDINSREHSSHCSTFFSVILQQDEELAALLLNAGADINLGGYSGNTPLSELLEQGRIETVKWLFYHGAKVELDDPYGGTALTISSENGDEEMVRFLHEKDMA